MEECRKCVHWIKASYEDHGFCNLSFRTFNLVDSFSLVVSYRHGLNMSCLEDFRYDPDWNYRPPVLKGAELLTILGPILGREQATQKGRDKCKKSKRADARTEFHEVRVTNALQRLKLQEKNENTIPNPISYRLPDVPDDYEDKEKLAEKLYQERRRRTLYQILYAVFVVVYGCLCFVSGCLMGL